ncbi:TetR/AcrR family transcriptional regulator [Porticoccaceae bacterium]|nr:TetR/AcrR family transcriptional regulator [Porticoccaceae bacterium]
MKTNIKARKEPGQDRSRATLQSIMNASAELIAANGLDATSMTQIANLAGLSKASLYRYFPNKQALLLALAKRSFKTHREEMQAIMQLDKDPEQILRDGIGHYCDKHSNNPFFFEFTRCHPCRPSAIRTGPSRQPRECSTTLDVSNTAFSAD